ncbi:hypothetical protein [Haloferula sp. A504]|uniref:hypothetical protein n=1 Tax=Haloferula sp. A504 TaxID=3373601 RepID=UPI0031C90CF4|nr:hypothetical protein [Verrucomicrobiaceae bacterium E54]
MPVFFQHHRRRWQTGGSMPDFAGLPRIQDPPRAVSEGQALRASSDIAMARFKIAVNMEFCRSADQSFEAGISLAFLKKLLGPQ